MQPETLWQRLGGLVLAGVILSSSALVRAEGEAAAPEATTPAPEAVTPPAAEETPAPRSFWLGLNCELLDDESRSELKVEADKGLVVEDVLPHSPAQAAGLEPRDVLLKAGDRPLTSKADLVAVVEASAGEEFAIEIWRDGRAETVKIRPAERPRGLAARRLPGGLLGDLTKNLPEGMVEGLEGAMRELEGTLEGARGGDGAMLFRWLGPGVVMGEPMPDDLSVTITRKGKDLPRIIVERGSDRWELTGDQLETLPEDIRPFVERMLGPEARIVAHRAGEARELAERELDRARREMDRVRRHLRERRMPGVAPVAPPAPGQPVPPVPHPGSSAPEAVMVPPPEMFHQLEADVHRLVEGAMHELTRRIEEIQRERGLTEEALSRRLAELESRLREREPEIRANLEQMLQQKSEELSRAIGEQTSRLEKLIEELAKAAAEVQPKADKPL